MGLNIDERTHPRFCTEHGRDIAGVCTSLLYRMRSRYSGVCDAMLEELFSYGNIVAMRGNLF